MGTAREALTRLRLRREMDEDPSIAQGLKRGGWTFEDLVRETMAMTPNGAAAPPVQSAPAIALRRKGARKQSLGMLLYRLLLDGGPMLRADLRAKAKESSEWVRGLEAPDRSMDNAIGKLIREGLAREVEGPKPKKVEAIRQEADASEFF